MSQKQDVAPRADVLYRLAGITGLAWTVLILAYVATVMGYGHGHVAEPQSLLRLGAVLFVVTLGLDGLQDRLLDEDR